MVSAVSRRAALQVGGASLLGLSYPRFLAAKPASKARVKSIIFLHQWGGPGQHETFDPKPDASRTFAADTAGQCL